MTGLACDRLTYRVGDATLVQDVSLSVGSGELVAVVGPNGAGKSSLIRLLAADLRPTSGEVAIGGRKVSEMRPGELARERAVLLQESDPAIPFLVRDVVAFGRYPHRRDTDNSRRHDVEATDEAMRVTDTFHLRARTFASLSTGERARVSLARVLAQEATVLLLDEPTAALDVRHQEQILARIRAEAARGAAITVVLHDLNAAAAYADRIVILHRGSTVADGSPSDVLTDDLLTDVYEQEMRVVENPFRSCPLVLVVG